MIGSSMEGSPTAWDSLAVMSWLNSLGFFPGRKGNVRKGSGGKSCKKVGKSCTGFIRHVKDSRVNDKIHAKGWQAMH